MTKLFSLLFLLCITAISFAQNLISKVPAGASVVIRYSGNNLAQKLPASKFDTYTSLKNKIFKELKINSKTSVNEIGIDLQQDAYQFMTTTDSTTCFATIGTINDAAKFNKFIQSIKKDTVSIINNPGFQFYPLSSSAFLGWNGKIVSIVVSTYRNNKYYQSDLNNDSATAVVADTVAVISDTATDSFNDDDSYSIKEKREDSIRQEAETKFYQEQDIQNKAVRLSIAEGMLTNLFNSSTTSIQNNTSFNKLVDKTADVSIWIDSTGIFNHLFPRNDYNLNSWFGIAQGVNVYFENNKIRIEQKAFAAKDSAGKALKAVFNSKQDAMYVNYVHPTDIGYLSMSVNTEAMINYYYVVLKKVFESKDAYFKTDSSLVDTYVDLLQVFLDEKGIADLAPGNSFFVLHGLKSKQVKYTDYSYDKDFNATKVQKTKTELSPDFSFIFDTKNEKIFNKLMDLPIKLNKSQSYDYKKTGNFYTLNLGKDNFLEKVYFMVKDGKCIITTSLQQVANPTYNKTTTVDAATADAILNSNYAASFDVKKLIKGLGTNITDASDKKRITYLQDNIKNITFKSNITDDAYGSTTIINIDGKHNDSFSYLFDVMEKLLEIKEGH